MNAQQARMINMPDLLSRMGYQPYGTPRKGGREIWYLSPLPGRNETVPSFHISFINKKWLWKDFGAEKGGNVIDFVIEHQGTDFKGAMKFLRQVFQADFFEKKTDKTSECSLFSYQSHLEEKADADVRCLEFLKASPIHSPVIFQYLKNRGIPSTIANKHLLEIKYLNKPKNKVFFGFGMRNLSDGYELRSASHKYAFKSALIKRDISLLPSSKSAARSVSIFEGMVDALSLLTLKNREQPEHDYLILHSTSSFGRAVKIIQERNCETIFTYLDNDPTGEKTRVRFQEIFTDRIAPQNNFYKGYNDVNDFLLGRGQKNARTDPEAFTGEKTAKSN